jgi:sulfatase maturation enzyme AslB (radical SAM superfamily)
MSDERMQQIRDLILSGERVSECESCYAQEDKKLISRRQRLLKDFSTKKDKVDRAITQHIAGQIPEPIYYDLRYSNLCNLECQMCDALHSSSIAERQSKEIIFLKSELDIKINKEAERIYLAGGEPFLIKSFSKLLNNISNKNCEIVVNTNATILTKHLLTELKKFNNVSFFVSIDGYHSVNEKIRKNSVWDDIVKNVKILSDYGGIYIHTVIQKDNVNRLLELGKWIETHNVQEWKLTICEDPQELHFSHCETIDIPAELYSLKLVKQNMSSIRTLNEIKKYAKN